MEEVAEMAIGLAKDRRERRRTVLEATFGKNAVKSSEEKGHIPGKQLSNYQGKTSARNKSNDLGTRKPNLKRTGEEEETEGVPPKRPRAQDTTDVCSRPPECVMKEKSLMALRAQLGILQEKGSTMDMLTQACHRSKCMWKVDVKRSMHDLSTHLWLTIEDVLVVHICHGTDQNTSKLAACKIAISQLRDNETLEVRQEKFNKDKIKLALYVSGDRRVTWKGPEMNLYQFQMEQLALVKTQLMKFKTEWETEPEKVLRNACTQANAELVHKEQQLQGWKQHLQVFVGGTCAAQVLLQGKELAKTKEEENLNSAYKLAINNVTQAYHKLYEDDTNVIRLIASDRPIADEDLSKHIRTSVTPLKDDFEKSETEIGTKYLELGKRFVLVSCCVLIDGLELAKWSSPYPKQVVRDACLTALKFASKFCFTMTKHTSIDSTVEQIGADTIGESSASKPSAPTMSSASMKMMQKMGWTGGGIGKQGQGISEPVTVQEVIRRQGLGMAVTKGAGPQFGRTLKIMLQEYYDSANIKDMVFSTDFSNEQRKQIHVIAHRMGLKSISYGKGDNRQITIQKHATALQLLQNLIENGGEDGKYSLELPSRMDLLQKYVDTM